jgi:hypothetical protein
MADIPSGRLTNISLPDAYGKRMFIQQKSQCHSYTLWMVDQAVCSPSVCIRLFLPQHKKITFVSQGAHWRTDAHNGKQQDL